MQSSYLTSAQKANQLPNYTLPEVAFIGRSNCGKSALLNALLGRKNLARSSSTPGRTQMVNFFSLALSSTEQMVFADLPGYGFNVARKEIRDLWDSLLAQYIARPNICEFLYLTDIRRDFEDFECEYMRHLSERIPLIVVLTKSDKVGKNECAKKKAQIAKELKAEKIQVRQVVATSTLGEKTGLEALRELLFSHAKATPSQPAS